jgi:hypothetical protein
VTERLAHLKVADVKFRFSEERYGWICRSLIGMLSQAIYWWTTIL